MGSPSGDRSIPSGNRSIPSGDRSIPSGDRSIRGGAPIAVRLALPVFGRLLPAVPGQVTAHKLLACRVVLVSQSAKRRNLLKGLG